MISCKNVSRRVNVSEPVSQADRAMITRRAEEESGKILNEIAAENGVGLTIGPIEKRVIKLDGRFVN